MKPVCDVLASGSFAARVGESWAELSCELALATEPNARLVVAGAACDNDGTNAAARTATAINSVLIPLLLVVLTRLWQRRRPRSYRSPDKPATGIFQGEGMTCPAKDN
ncbi:hypothetical protein [Candidatus Solirubrobacter pratensis]|uniref:hypothetical protein n=1 Tax=Candidatus Solirubrobacter pratensis TaxID=1298857 RepID=UPI0012DC6930|nr:hypothetical protein [Candidatus Solirubrobacter pratensis]